MFQICFQANHSQDRVFKISKNIQNFGYKYISGHALHYGQIHYIRVYEKSNFKSLIIGNLYVKLLAFLEKDPS